MTIIKLNIEIDVGTLTTMGGRIKNETWRMTTKNGGIIKFPVKATMNVVPSHSVDVVDAVASIKKKRSRGRTIKVKSSWVSALQYDMKGNTLIVHCNQGSTYQYKDVAPSMWFHLQQIAEGGGSIGQFINHHVKGQYRGERVS